MTKIEQYGWNTNWQKKINAPGIPGRVTLEHKNLYRVVTENGEWLCSLSGKYRHQHHGTEFPCVGDWVMTEQMPGEEKGIIQQVLPRTSQFSRKGAGETSDIQLIAVNVDTVFLSMSLNHDFNVRRLERYLLAAWDSGSNPVIVLTKKDQCQDIDPYMRQVESVAFGVPVFAVSALTGEGIEELQKQLSSSKTGALLGSSGVGKSSLINALSGSEQMMVQDIRKDDSKGRHTTTHREMILLPAGGLMIDTPGMREFQLGDYSEGIEAGFSDVEELAIACRFRDCAHHDEPGCSVQEALQNGALDAGRYGSYLKLKRELAHMERKSDAAAQKAERNKWKQLTKDSRKRPVKKN
ncbi:GTPase RsgA [Planococcus antarcticus DSM 14505]|uniref:Small ribosomal subunit biogenesis GTPase RsgA n=1 Tax=Planococcus antarcticus DSM 14505 TaxID=1185653 RepID=A0A1C7DJB0_9BACL|nr:ribosome small subunit-dependent GTPase A [Planococcus antarcticus]ANU11660.1 ribosome small subunit-dependent GTPase A [Planococcus antarcticus DSM 14505]EIM08280.1 GTPase RsgA [Planococcus antarcticus DSM 14505]